MTFEELSLNKSLQRALIDQGYSTPTPIQEKAIPIILNGEDLVGCAQTGTGKTAAFAIPILNHLHHMVGSSKKAKKIRALIVTPTRELAIQIGENFDAYGKYTNLNQLTIFGGVSQVNQVDQLKKGVDILIATPGRLLDLNKQGFIDLDHLHFLVLDEADQMLDMGFINDVKKIVKLTPDNRQTLLFSATMPIAIRELADTLLKSPKYVTVSPVSSTAETVKQKIYFVSKLNKRKLLYHLISEEKLSGVLVFSRTKHGADNVVKALKKNGVKAEAIHGDKSQSARQRVLESFKAKETTVLVATDIAARGIDIDQLPYVINFDLPNVPETYVHRIGRTGRAGHEGIAISFCSADEKPYWKDILKLTNVHVKTVDNHPFPYTDEELKEELHTSANAKKKPANRSGSRNTPAATEAKTENKTAAKGSPKSRKSASSKENKKRWY
ncbi:DEAD/DEAH box helicase [Flavobacterium sp. JP2137]|uniref:DEAD/DEAH box helicase n=1 Tax=Flavobacterium sp. JP2137 TaxID=3414510 RepID=UPI003D2FB080